MLGLSRKIVSLCGAAGFFFCIFVVAAQDRDGAEAKTDLAHVVVYRTGLHRDPKIVKPSVYCGDEELALMYSGRYFTVALSPGKHEISSSNEHKAPVELDAKPGDTFYVRVAVVKGKWLNNTFAAEQVDANTALKEIAHLKPADPDHVVARDIVSLSPIPGK
jgi:hypothetical protein